MLRVYWVAWIFSAGMMVLGADMASGQNYPNKPIRILTVGPGGSSDIAARLIAQGIAGPLGQQVVVENRAGVVTIDNVLKAPPDGYSLLYSGSSLWLPPLLRDNVPYDPVRDFSPIALTTTAPNILVVHPSLPVRSVKELIALAKARPGELNYASSPSGTSTHLAGELFKVMAGVNIVRVPYKGGGAALNDLMGGQVQLSLANAGSVTPHLKSGRLRALAVSSAEPSALAPNLPTISASGLPGYESASIQGLFAPAGTPAATIHRLNQEIVQVVNRPEVKQKFLVSGIETVGSSPEQFAAAVKAEMLKWGKVIKEAGIREE